MELPLQGDEALSVVETDLLGSLRKGLANHFIRLKKENKCAGIEHDVDCDGEPGTMVEPAGSRFVRLAGMGERRRHSRTLLLERRSQDHRAGLCKNHGPIETDVKHSRRRRDRRSSSGHDSGNVIRVTQSGRHLDSSGRQSVGALARPPV